MSPVEHAANLFDYFHSRVDDAHGVVSTELSDDTRLYLTTLLVDRARTDRSAELPEQTLAELFGRAAAAPPAEKARTYREMGDRSLYLVGYFEESLSRSTVSPSYYCDMGSAAYAQADQVFKRWFSDAFDDLFRELARHFRECVDVLREVRRTVDAEPDLLGRLYQAWLETGSEAAAERLRAHGLLLPPRPTEA
jgi:hypothetical protein